MLPVTRRDPFTGDINTMTLPISERQLEVYEDGLVSANEAFPDLTPEQREFIMSGIMPETWDAVFGKEEE